MLMELELFMQVGQVEISALDTIPEQHVLITTLMLQGLHLSTAPQQL